MLFCVSQMYWRYFPNKLLQTISQILSIFPDKQIFWVIYLGIRFSGMLQMTLPNWYITLREPIKLSKTFFPTKYKQSLYFANEITWNAIYQKIHWTLHVVWLNQKMLTFPLEKERRRKLPQVSETEYHQSNHSLSHQHLILFILWALKKRKNDC